MAENRDLLAELQASVDRARASRNQEDPVRHPKAACSSCNDAIVPARATIHETENPGHVVTISDIATSARIPREEWQFQDPANHPTESAAVPVEEFDGGAEEDATDPFPDLSLSALIGQFRADVRDAEAVAEHMEPSAGAAYIVSEVHLDLDLLTRIVTARGL